SRARLVPWGLAGRANHRARQVYRQQRHRRRLPDRTDRPGRRTGTACPAPPRDDSYSGSRVSTLIRAAWATVGGAPWRRHERALVRVVLRPPCFVRDRAAAATADDRRTPAHA